MKRKILVQICILLFCTAVQPGMGAPVLSLGLKPAVLLAIQNNLTALTAEEKIKEAEGRELEALSKLLPNFYARASQSNNTSNLAATGFPVKSVLGGLNPLIGPYYTFDARLQLAQTLFNLSAYRQHQASQIDFQIAGLQRDLAREQIAAATEVAYLNVLASQEAVRSAQANVELAENLDKLAMDRHQAGIATGVDVARAHTQLAVQQTALSEAQTSDGQAEIQLKRLIGVSLDSNILLADPLDFKPQPLSAVDRLLGQAYGQRVEIKIADAEVRLNDYSLQAARGERIPSLGFSANYGESGNTPGLLSLPTRSFAVNMDVPIFNGDLTRGHVLQAESRERQAKLTQEDTQVQVEEDVRLAFQTLLTTTEEVKSANQSVDLADRELSLSRDRFAAGLTDNVEVVEAQTALENARNARVRALADYNRTRINLASALGQAQNFDF